MIQRKQSLFLLVAVCAWAMCFMFPIASFTAKAPLGIPVSGELNLIAKDNPTLMTDILNGNAVTMNQKEYIKVWPLTVLTLLSGLTALVALFLFKNRVLQMRVVAVAFLLGVVEVFLVFIWAVDAYINKVTVPMACEDISVHYGIGTWCAIIAVVLLFLAQRAIRKDEEKVRAADRLR
ncbi:MAG: DUF4293 domain-containing protein [Bacteroidales bacterium]|nr:DUF4293 domain-containing protein [Bacteroidales bacterium]